MIACDRKSLYPPKIAVAEDTLDLLEEKFQLHPTTLQTLLSPTGTFSRHTDRKHGDPSNIRRIQLLLKSPQKYEIANYGMSLNFDEKTRITTALLFGERVTNTIPEIEEKEIVKQEAALPSATKPVSPFARLVRTMKHAGLSSGHPLPENEAKEAAKQEPAASHSIAKHVSPFDRLVHILKDSRLSWDHPLLLPSALLSDHINRTRMFCEGRLAKKVYQMEKDIDVTKVGSRNDLGEEGLGPDYRDQELAFNFNPLFDRSHILKLLVHLNTLYTRVLFTQGSPTWNKEASQFLEHVHSELLGSTIWETSNDHALTELLEYNSNVATTLKSVVSSLQTRMELQLSILYSFTSQGDNRINERIALNSGRDSTSMKILALISALFLPATFVATVFSMSMFQWQPNGGNGDHSSATVSDKIWIYPATAIPLTVVTVVGWGVWWWWELRKYDQAMNDHVSHVSEGLFGCNERRLTTSYSK